MILMKDIIRENNPILHCKSQDVQIPLNPDDEKALKDMIEYLFNSQDEKLQEKYGLRAGVGLAAPQIGLNKKMLVILAYDEKGNSYFLPMVNPKLISYSEELTYLESGEGCLSVDREVKGYVHRPRRVSVDTYLYDKGQLNHVRLRLKNYIAIVFQHEYDHLNGILFVDRIKKDDPFYIPKNSTPIKFENDDE